VTGVTGVREEFETPFGQAVSVPVEVPIGLKFLMPE
jgi:hypothetical protein